jgi:hypothetical protein
VDLRIHKRLPFCGRCGASTDAKNLLPNGEDGQLSRIERRQLSVMFCDLPELVALGGQLDPEEAHDVSRAYQSIWAQIIQHHGGRIAQVVSDSLLIYFGYPESHEDDAQRAVARLLRLSQQLQRRVHWTENSKYALLFIQGWWWSVDWVVKLIPTQWQFWAQPLISRHGLEV